MIALTELWLPILLSAVFVFICSSIIHMVLPIHKGDYTKLPGEDEVLELMRAHAVAPGSYMLPRPNSVKDMATPEMIEKYNRGPVGFLTVMPSGPPTMGKNLVLWFLYCVASGVFVAYLATLALNEAADYMSVFRVTGTVAFLAYAFSSVTDSIWKGQRWGITLKFVWDGVIYAFVTAGTFGWLWPQAV